MIKELLNEGPGLDPNLCGNFPRTGQSITKERDNWRTSGIFPHDYSSLSAIIGCSFAALLAGIVLANTETAASPKHAIAIIAGS